MFGVDEGCDAALFLGLGDDVQGEGCLTTRLGAVDFDDAALGDSLTAQGDVERQAAGRNAFDSLDVVGAERHDRAFAELLFDRGNRVP